MIVFYASDKAREQALAAAFAAGARKRGFKVQIRSPVDPVDCAVACMVGVKSRKLWHHFKKRGTFTMMFDKGYSRHRLGGCWEYWRVAFDSHNPVLTLDEDFPSDRFEALGLTVKPWRKKGGHILIAGSSEKYHNFYHMINPNEYAFAMVQSLRHFTNRPIIYRPKPSWRGAREIDGTIFSPSKQPLQEVLNDCHAVITHGSNTCYEAALAGIPSIVLGNGVMRDISSTNLTDVEDPLMGDRQWLFNALAYHQWTLKEFQSGLAFETIGEWL